MGQDFLASKDVGRPEEVYARKGCSEIPFAGQLHAVQAVTPYRYRGKHPQMVFLPKPGLPPLPLIQGLEKGIILGRDDSGDFQPCRPLALVNKLRGQQTAVPNGARGNLVMDS